MRRARLLAVALTCLFLTGCSGYTRYSRSELGKWPPVDNGGKSLIGVGNSVKMHTAGGVVISGDIESLNENGCTVDGQPLAFAQVEVIQVHKILWAPTIAIAAGATVLGVIVFTSPGTFDTHD